MDYIDDPYNFKLEVNIDEFYYDVFESAMTPAEVCRKHITAISIAVETTASECEMGLTEILTMFGSYTIDDIVENIVDGEYQYTVTVSVIGHDLVYTVTFDAIFNQDYSMLQGCIRLIAVFFVFSNLIIDLMYAYIDPRISYDR